MAFPNKDIEADIMDIVIKEEFMEKWNKFLPGEELPVACWYADEIGDADFPAKPKPNKRGYTCIFSQLAPDDFEISVI